MPNITPVKATILAALNIADELFKMKNDQEKMTKFIEDKTNTLTALFD
jgi:cell division protein ZapA (FtsZ GTPase activity inhibitor)